MPPGQSKDRDPSDRIPKPGGAPQRFKDANSLEVALPAGGRMNLSTPGEVIMWEETARRYIADYSLKKANDLLQLGGILSQALMMFRAQQDLADPDKAMVAQATIKMATDEIRKAEKALGVDKATRERGGQHTVGDYVSRVKRAGYEKGIRISDRVLEIERVFMKVSTDIRVLRNGDREDRDYHKISEKSIVDYMETEIAIIHSKDKEWSKEKGAIFVGTL